VRAYAPDGRVVVVEERYDVVPHKVEQRVRDQVEGAQRLQRQPCQPRALQLA
jgi:hypothetical protein